MKKITANEFFDTWYLKAETKSLEISANWDRHGELTQTVMSCESPLIADVADDFDLEFYCEYYRIDAVFFQANDKVPLKSTETCLRRIRIAFEHENDFNSGLFREISHLLITNCDLRVLVTYPSYTDELNNQLKYLHTVISGTYSASEVAEKKTLLIIIGWDCKDYISWYGFIYCQNKWQLLTESKPAEFVKSENDLDVSELILSYL
jgi:hypothetical protein